MEYMSIKSLNYPVWRMLVELYKSDPLTHVYLMYDIVYELENSDIHIVVGNDKILGYLLVWKDPATGFLGVHIWGSNADVLVDRIPVRRAAVIQVYNDELVDVVTRKVEEKGLNLDVKRFLNMVADSETFKPYKPEVAVRLTDEHIEAFIKLKSTQGQKLDKRSAEVRLRKWTYYGIFENEVLASIACCYLRMNEVWLIGDVFTDPKYRRRGFAKMATSTVTEKAINSGAIAMLHVDSDNGVARHLYETLGYRVTGGRYWIMIRD
ncbi:MAG: GNAT family N-acetyltransferase [Candidatus Baldrarchaeia archaeon]